MELLQKVHAHNLVRWAKDKPEVVVFSADLTSSCEADVFRDAYPDRFFSMGLTEQNMLSMAGGMAREGYFPYIHTFAVFIYRRALDQIAMSIAYPNVPVRLIGFLPGIMTPGGASHQAIEDVAVMRSLPNMTILETGDATEVETVLDVAQAVNGPVYVRMLRGEIPRLFDKSEPFVLGRARVLSRGTDIALITSGICTEEAMRVTHLLREKGVSIQHLHVSTLKPFTDPAVLEAVSAVKHGVIAMENHTVVGGLGSAVAEVMAENGVGRRLVRMGLKDTFAHGASKQYLMREYGLDALALVGEVEKLLGAAFNIREGDLQAVRLTAVHSEAKAEAL
ncbi:MAG TPA: transketolase C-terminal domain-containing protein [Symbiobacteriaceae bacterium]|nr:transketolase C-terminal domain-containing protein [Symbiobacteriaceae bacterium]